MEKVPILINSKDRAFTNEGNREDMEYGQPERRPTEVPASRPGSSPMEAGAVPETTSNKPEGELQGAATQDLSPEHQARLLNQAVFPSAMAEAVGLDKHFDVLGYAEFLRQLLRDAGDPGERILLAQLAMCHLRSATLHGRAGKAEGEAARLYNDAAARGRHWSYRNSAPRVAEKPDGPVLSVGTD